MSKKKFDPEYELGFRKPMLVIHYNRFGYSICPRCGDWVEHRYQSFCGACGQRLQWRVTKMILVPCT